MSEKNPRRVAAGLRQRVLVQRQRAIGAFVIAGVCAAFAATLFWHGIFYFGSWALLAYALYSAFLGMADAGIMRDKKERLGEVESRIAGRTKGDEERTEIAAVIRRFLDGSAGRWEWDDLTSLRLSDPELEGVRLRAAAIADLYPPTEAGHYCSAEGMAELRKLAAHLEQRAHGRSRSSSQ
jgi:hypothetical protein